MADYSADYRISYGDSGACRLDFRCFDTPNSITLFGCSTPDWSAEGLLAELRRGCLELHLLWSFSRAGSDVARLNDGSSRIVEVDARTAGLIEAMKSFHRSEPRFDFTIGPASFLWKQARPAPGDACILEALSHVGASKVHVEGRRVVKDDPLAQIDVGGAAKGFAADAVAAALRRAGYASADVDLGGNLYLVGRHPEGRPWRVRVRVPEGICAEPDLLEVADASVVTSGTYERFVEIGGERFHHIVDPLTGRPARTDLVSVSVIGESSLEADMLATAAVVGGSGELDALSLRHPRYRFVALCRDGAVLDFGG